VDQLIAVFKQRYGRHPIYHVAAPGRVNLIGEHTDYNGLPVLPMTLGRHIQLLCSPRDDDIVEISNCQSCYPDRKFSISTDIPRFPSGDWGNYIKAAVQQLVRHHVAAGNNLCTLKGFSALVCGNVPVAAGLSSSSALVVASGLAFNAVNGLTTERFEMADLMASAEYYVGTQGGGMDQAVCLLSRREMACKIDFFPLRVENVELPLDCSVVVINSLVRAPKSESARFQYNRRPIECRLAFALVQQYLLSSSAGFTELKSCSLLGELDAAMEELGLDWRRVGARVLGLRRCWSLAEVADSLGLTKEEVRDRFLRLAGGSVFPEPEDGFKLGLRYRHVLAEGRRVRAAVDCLRSGDVIQFGRLMCQSHASCRDDYEISCEQVDKLVSIARGAGALGARITGAGFGGCVVSLVKNSDVEAFAEHVRKAYFERYLVRQWPALYQDYRQAGADNVVLVCRASGSASVQTLASDSSHQDRAV